MHDTTNIHSNYKKLGPYIKPVDIRNKNLEVETLLGVSVQKVFIPSIANTVGTDFRKYKIVKKKQFTYIPDTSRRGDKIGIAMLEEHDIALVSQAYSVFEITNHDELEPEYLMMWFRRPEFDRYARYKSHGSVREIFDWEEMCEIELPIPSIEKQREIVKEYNTIVNRIKLNEQLNQKLEETAQALYKHWFVDFEFPNEDGKPYKSSGGNMVYNEELDKEIPEGWKDELLQTLIDFKNGKKKPCQTGNYPIYGGNGILGYANKSNYKDVIAIGRVGAYCGSLFRVKDECWISDNAIAGKSRNGYQMFAFDMLKSLGLNERSEGTGQPLLTQGILNNIKIAIPPKHIIEKYNAYSEVIFFNLNNVDNAKRNLKELEGLILSKMTKVETEKEVLQN